MAKNEGNNKNKNVFIRTVPIDLYKKIRTTAILDEIYTEELYKICLHLGIEEYMKQREKYTSKGINNSFDAYKKIFDT